MFYPPYHIWCALSTRNTKEFLINKKFTPFLVYKKLLFNHFLPIAPEISSVVRNIKICASKTHKIYVQTIYPALKYIKKGKGLRIRAILFIQSSSEIF